MDDQNALLEDNKTWKYVTLPPGRKLFKWKWIYKTKLAVDGTTTNYKARLVGKGYSQVHGLDYNETFTPVERMDSIRQVLAVASSKRWEAHHMDVKSSFLHGDVKEEIYMRQPEEYIEDSSLVCKMRKSLYGCKYFLPPWWHEIGYLYEIA